MFSNEYVNCSLKKKHTPLFPISITSSLIHILCDVYIANCTQNYYHKLHKSRKCNTLVQFLCLFYGKNKVSDLFFALIPFNRAVGIIANIEQHFVVEPIISPCIVNEQKIVLLCRYLWDFNGIRRFFIYTSFEATHSHLHFKSVCFFFQSNICLINKLRKIFSIRTMKNLFCFIFDSRNLTGQLDFEWKALLCISDTNRILR